MRIKHWRRIGAKFGNRDFNDYDEKNLLNLVLSNENFSKMNIVGCLSRDEPELKQSKLNARSSMRPRELFLMDSAGVSIELRASRSSI